MPVIITRRFLDVMLVAYIDNFILNIHAIDVLIINIVSLYFMYLRINN